MKTLLLTLATLAALVGLPGAPAQASDDGPTGLPACQYEDSYNCYWDATASGNGKGHSFVAVKHDDKVCVYYKGKKYARSHNYCTHDMGSGPSK